MKKIKITYDPTKKLNQFTTDYGRGDKMLKLNKNTWEFKIGYFECQDTLLVLFMLIVMSRLK